MGPSAGACAARGAFSPFSSDVGVVAAVDVLHGGLSGVAYSASGNDGELVFASRGECSGLGASAFVVWRLAVAGCVVCLDCGPSLAGVSTTAFARLVGVLLEHSLKVVVFGRVEVVRSFGRGPSHRPI